MRKRSDCVRAPVDIITVYVVNVCYNFIYMRQLRATFRLIGVFFRHESRIYIRWKNTHSYGCSYILHLNTFFKMLIRFRGWLGREEEIKGAKYPRVFGDAQVSQTINPEIHSRRERSSQGPDPPALSDLT